MTKLQQYLAVGSEYFEYRKYLYDFRTSPTSHAITFLPESLIFAQDEVFLKTFNHH